MGEARQRSSGGVEGRYMYLLEQSHALRHGHGRRWFPALRVCIFDHKPGYVATDSSAVRSALSVTVDWTSCSEFDGYGRSASQKGREEQSDEGKQRDHDAVGSRESTL